MNMPALPVKHSALSGISRQAFVAYVRATWKPILIGDLMRINVMSIAFGLAFDIILCGVGGAFSLLVAAAAVALPPTPRVVIWLGCAFALVTAIDRPSFKSILSLPLIIVVISVGSVSLAARIADLVPELVVYFSLLAMFQGLGFGVTMLLGLWIAQLFGNEIIRLMTTQKETTEQRMQAKAYFAILRQHYRFRGAVYVWRADGTMVIPTSHRRFQTLSADELSSWLDCPVELKPRRNIFWDDVIILHPPLAQPEVTDASR